MDVPGLTTTYMRDAGGEGRGLFQTFTAFQIAERRGRRPDYSSREKQHFGDHDYCTVPDKSRDSHPLPRLALNRSFEGSQSGHCEVGHGHLLFVGVKLHLAVLKNTVRFQFFKDHTQNITQSKHH